MMLRSLRHNKQRHRVAESIARLGLRHAENSDPNLTFQELDYPLLSSKTRERLREQAEKMKKNLAAARLVALSSP
eukprot:451220-Amorphochlora_amoeboformis.AAC.1